MLSVFNLILVTMTAFDTVYLGLSVAEFAFVETFHITSEFYDKVGDKAVSFFPLNERRA